MVEMILRWSKNPPGSSLPRGSGEPLGSQSLLLSCNSYYSEREYLSGQQRRTQDPFAQAFAGSTPASRIFKDPFIKCLSHPYIIAENRQQKHIAGLSDRIYSRNYPLFFTPLQIWIPRPSVPVPSSVHYRSFGDRRYNHRSDPEWIKLQKTHPKVRETLGG